MCGLFVALLSYIFAKTFFFEDSSSTTIIFAALCSIMMITLIGLLDDLLIRKVSADIYVGLQRWQKPLLTIPAAIPLMVIKAGTTHMVIPFYGPVDFGMIYPLLLVPIGVVGAANMVNLLEGFNGIASGMGLIYSFSLGLYAYMNGRIEAAILAFALFGALLAFFKFNFVPAKVFPGDSLTYLLGGAIACIAIIGNIEKAAIIASIPFIIEFLLKARSKFQAQTYGIALSNGKIMSKYDKIYSLPHLLTITAKYTEKQIVLAMMGLELIFCILIWVV
jgi:UDP-N-acetylglucosamine--dolichyl-phosphate N-acetylglucosaminephosphotransferase